MFLAEMSKTAGTIIMVVVLVALVAVVFIMPMINNKKQQKSYKDMLDNVKVGSTVKTIGGMIGKVVNVTSVGNQKEVEIETGEGATKTTMFFDVNAVYQVIDSQTHEPIPMAAADKTAKKGKKETEAIPADDSAEKAEEAPAEPGEQADESEKDSH